MKANEEEVDNLSRKYRLLLAGCLLSASLALAACGATPAVQRGLLDSGPVDQSYQGVAQPKVPAAVLKLSDEEIRNGIKKFPIKARTGQTLVPEVQVQATPGQEKAGQASDVAKPQV